MKRLLIFFTVVACAPPPSTTATPLAGVGPRPALKSFAGQSPSYSGEELAGMIGTEQTEVERITDVLYPPDDSEAIGEEVGGEGPLTDEELAAASDLRVLSRRVELLVACMESRAPCPPHLESSAPSPPVDPLRYDPPQLATAEAWRQWSASLHREACACRTMGCVDGYTEELVRLEQVVAPAVQGDDAALEHVVAARGCLWWLRGR